LQKQWTQKLWIYDLRTNMHFTLKENTLKRIDLDDFVGCYFGKVAAASRRSPEEFNQRRDGVATLETVSSSSAARIASRPNGSSHSPMTI